MYICIFVLIILFWNWAATCIFALKITDCMSETLYMPKYWLSFLIFILCWQLLFQILHYVYICIEHFSLNIVKQKKTSELLHESNPQMYVLEHIDFKETLGCDYDKSSYQVLSCWYKNFLVKDAESKKINNVPFKKAGIYGLVITWIYMQHHWSIPQESTALCKKYLKSLRIFFCH